MRRQSFYSGPEQTKALQYGTAPVPRAQHECDYRSTISTCVDLDLPMGIRMTVIVQYTAKVGGENGSHRPGGLSKAARMDLANCSGCGGNGCPHPSGEA
jgi:hypothetical protein